MLIKVMNSYHYMININNFKTSGQRIEHTEQLHYLAYGKI